MTTAIVWFRRDLRLADHPALTHALHAHERVIPVYVHAPDEEAPWQPGAASRWWLHHSLFALSASLRACGSTLIVRRGPTLKTLRELARETGARSICFNRVYDPALVERDRRIERALEDSGVEVRTFKAALLFEPAEVRNAAHQPYRVFTPFWRACAARLAEVGAALPPPHRFESCPLGLASTPLDELRLRPAIPWDAGLREAWQPGEAGANRRLTRFMDTSIATYTDDRDRPDLAGSSRLSPHLHFGEISPRQVVAAALQRAAGDSRAGAQRGTDTFLREIGWREFGHHLLCHFPETATRSLDERFERFDWRKDARAFAAWAAGRTGIPLVDAGMRELWHTGWMHNRVRMVVASFLTKNLRMHWLEGARWFWDTLVDADLANNTLGWQWTAGCGADAAPYFRIFNPFTQAKRFDPDGAYVRRWVPELANGGKRYHEPIVDLSASRAAALAAYAALRN